MEETGRKDAASMLAEFNTPTQMPQREEAIEPKAKNGKSRPGSWWGSLRAVFALPDASPNERLVLLALLSRSRGARTAIVGIDELAKLCGCSERTVRRALRSAVERNLVAIQSRGNRVKGPTLYRLNLFNRSQCPLETRESTGHSVHLTPSQPAILSTLQPAILSAPLIERHTRGSGWSRSPLEKNGEGSA